MSTGVQYPSIQLQMENPEPFLQDLHGKVISVMLKWGWELRGILQSKDEYMNLLVTRTSIQLTNAEEVVNGESKGELG